MSLSWFQVNNLVHTSDLKYFIQKGIRRFTFDLDPRSTHFTSLSLIRQTVLSHPDLEFGVTLRESKKETVLALKNILQGLPLFWEALDFKTSEFLDLAEIPHNLHLEDECNFEQPPGAYVTSLSLYHSSQALELKSYYPWSLCVCDEGFRSQVEISYRFFQGYKLILNQNLDFSFRESNLEVIDKLWSRYA